MHHAFAFQMQAFPPDGYKVLMAPGLMHDRLKAVGTGWKIARFLWRFPDAIVPMTLVKAWANRWIRLPVETDVTYSTDHLVFRREPWILEVEFAALIVGGLAKHLRWFKRIVEQSLGSRYCRAIRCWSEAGRQSLLSDLDATHFRHKVQLIPYAVPPRRLVKEYRNGKVRILFVGPSTIAGGFDYGGGRETLVVFDALRQRYANLELVVRADVPRELKANCAARDGLRIIDRYISREELDLEFRSADIFMIPSHNTSPMTMLDAMSYELPIVTVDSWANKEYVRDGETGIVAPGSRRLGRYYAGTRQPAFHSEGFLRAIRTPDPEVVAHLAAKTSTLIENAELRRKMGRAARHEVEHGRFSFVRMNDGLKRLLDCATDTTSL